MAEPFKEIVLCLQRGRVRKKEKEAEREGKKEGEREKLKKERCIEDKNQSKMEGILKSGASESAKE